MYTGLAAGGRAVPCLPIKALCMFVAFQCKLAAGLFDHKARFLVRLWLGFPLRHLLPLSLSRPWTMEVPEHFRRVFCFIKENPWVLEGETLLDHRSLYSGVTGVTSQVTPGSSVTAAPSAVTTS